MTTGTFIFEWGNTKTEGDIKQATATISGAPRSGHPRMAALETEIFLPSLIAQGRKVVVRGLDSSDTHVYDESRQTLFIVTRDTDPGRTHKITVSLDPPLTPGFEVNDFWSDFGPRVIAFLVVIVGILAFWFLSLLHYI